MIKFIHYPLMFDEDTQEMRSDARRHIEKEYGKVKYLRYYPPKEYNCGGMCGDENCKEKLRTQPEYKATLLKSLDV